MTGSEWVSILTHGAVHRKPAYMNGTLYTIGKGQLATHDLPEEAQKLLLLQDDAEADQKHVADIALEDLLRRRPRDLIDGGEGRLRTYCRIVRITRGGKEER